MGALLAVDAVCGLRARRGPRFPAEARLQGGNRRARGGGRRGVAPGQGTLQASRAAARARRARPPGRVCVLERVTLAWSVAPDQPGSSSTARSRTCWRWLGARARGLVPPRDRARWRQGVPAIVPLLVLYGHRPEGAPRGAHRGRLHLNQTTLFPRSRAARFTGTRSRCSLRWRSRSRSRSPSTRRSPPGQLSSLVSVELLLVMLAFTYSRGGMLAAAVGLASGSG